jgi:hypothetical protein
LTGWLTLHGLTAEWIAGHTETGRMHRTKSSVSRFEIRTADGTLIDQIERSPTGTAKDSPSAERARAAGSGVLA